MANVLIIEDDEVFSELLAMHLEDREHEPQTARTLKQARQLLANNIPDAVLLDQQLPDGFGIDILKEIVEHSPHPPVIMITGVSDNTLAIQAMGLGAYDFIRKPMDEIELNTTLANALKSHRLSRQVSAITTADDYQVDVGQIVGKNPAILEICKTNLARLAVEIEARLQENQNRRDLSRRRVHGTYIRFRCHNKRTIKSGNIFQRCS